MREELKKLQNGSDIRGIACEGIANEHINLDADAARRIGIAFAGWLQKKTKKPAEELKIGVGTDSRVTGPAIKEAFLEGLASAGPAIYDCGMASTPAMFMSIVYPQTAFDAGCMITASHLPYNRNGIKFFDQDGGLEKEDIKDILGRAAALEDDDPRLAPAEAPAAEQVALIDIYCADLRTKICAAVNSADYEHPLAGLKVVVDAGNGAGGFFADKVLAPLGADTAGSQFLDPDGMFPNHVPNPENKEAMAAIVSATVENHADLGLIFDTDVDRMSAVLSDGTPINRDSIIAMIAAILAPDYPESTIITDSVTSDRLTAFLEGELGLKHLCFKRGYKNVINKCKELNASGITSPLAMETSGHGCLKENYYLDDGAFLAVKLLVAAAKEAKEGRTIDHLISALDKVCVDAEVRFPILEEDFGPYGQAVITGFADRAAQAGLELPKSYEGVRIKFSGDTTGWMLLRASLHDPVMVLNIEGRTQADFDAICKTTRELLAGCDGLDLSGLDKI